MKNFFIPGLKENSTLLAQVAELLSGGNVSRVLFKHDNNTRVHVALSCYYRCYHDDYGM